MYKKFISLLMLVGLAISITACTTNRNNPNKNVIEDTDLSGKIVENIDELNVKPIEEVTIVIMGSDKQYENNIQIQTDDTAYTVLEKAATDNKLGLVTKDYDFGKSIDGIGDDLAGNDNKYWIYYVNGEMAMQSADNQAVKDGDKIEFKFEESKF